MTTRGVARNDGETSATEAGNPGDRGRRGRRLGAGPERPATSDTSRTTTGVGGRKATRPSLTWQRGEASRRRIAAALVELLSESDRPPTVLEMANRAGVSLRLVFHHFGDVDAVYEMALEHEAAERWAPVVPPAPGLSLARRVEQTVRQRAELFEAVVPLRRAAAILAASRPDLALALAGGDAVSRWWLEVTFAPELAAAGRGRGDLLATVELVTSWEAWCRLRRVQGVSVPAARRLVGRALAGALRGAAGDD